LTILCIYSMIAYLLRKSKWASGISPCLFIIIRNRNFSNNFNRIDNKGYWYRKKLHTLHNKNKRGFASWKKVSGKKRNWNSLEISMPRKQRKMNRYELSKLVPIINSFEIYEKEFDDRSTSIRVDKMAILPFLLLESIIFRCSHKY